MIELYISQNKIVGSAAYGKYYPRVSYKQTMNIHDMAVHITYTDQGESGDEYDRG